MARIAKLMSIMVLLCLTFASEGEAARKVLFDTGHGEAFLIGEKGPLALSGFAKILQASDIEIETIQHPFSDASLAGAGALVISGAFAALHPNEIEAVVRFMQKGGKLAVMLHIAPPLSHLLDRLQVSYTNGVIRERQNIIENDPIRFRVDRISDHPVMQGVREFSLHGAWGVLNGNAGSRIIAATGPQAWIDLDRDGVQRKEETAAFGVVVAGEMGDGGFIIFGDDAIFQNKFLDENSKLLAANLAGWLK